MKIRLAPSLALAVAATLCAAHAQKKSNKAQPASVAAPAKSGAVTGWLMWRGPSQNGTSPETGLPDKVDAKAALWTADFPGQSTPVIANGRLYINGYTGDGADLREGTTCFDAETGKVIWQHFQNDFLSDTIYLRYSTSSPTIDPETGNVFVQATQGVLTCFTPDGKIVWQHSMMEEFGRLTFPNSRTCTPAIDRELVMVRGVTSGWGANGPAGDRTFAFDKKTGELVWLSSPADRPQDNTFSQPTFSWLDGKRVFYTACGDSSIACVNARTGDPLFRFRAAKAGAKGGINASPIIYHDSLIIAHESENVDTTEVGRTTSYRIPKTTDDSTETPPPGVTLPPGMKLFAAKGLEKWRNPLGNLASSPCLVGDTLYEVTGVGEVAAVSAKTGEVIWKKKLGAEQRQSSPFFADGKLYVAFYIAGTDASAAGGDNEVGNGELFVFKPGAKDAELLSRTKLTGRCFGSPIAYNGKLYVQTDKKLYAFGKKGDNAGAKAVEWKQDPEWTKATTASPAATKLQIIPNEVLLRPGQSAPLRVRALDSDGFTLNEAVDIKTVKFDSYIPPTALVKAKMTGAVVDGSLVAEKVTTPSAGAFMGVTQSGGKDINGTFRGRVQLDLPIKLDFESTELKEKTGPGIGNEPTALVSPGPGLPAPASGPTNWNVIEPQTAFSYPPLPWTGARFRFEVREAPGGGKALCKTIDNKLFQRGQVFIGHPDMHNYTIEADVLTEGNKRKMSDIGLINQRYLVVLRGNAREIELSSNLERVKVTAPFALASNEWYHMKVKVDVAQDGSGVVRASVWKKGDAEPATPTVEFKHKHAHQNGSPGFFSMTPQEQRAWIDNIEVKPN
ncbi:MAG: PQQ-binding-like beta-propeller repeat protein [Chthoniobacteraceae bacterium]